LGAAVGTLSEKRGDCISDAMVGQGPTLHFRLCPVATRTRQSRLNQIKPQGDAFMELTSLAAAL